MTQRTRITLTLDDSMTQRIDAVAQARDESRSAAIERMLKNSIGDEEEFLGSIGTGIEGRLMAMVMQSPKILNAMGKLLKEEADEELLNKIKEGGPSVVAAGKRFRSYNRPEIDSRGSKKAKGKKG